MGDLATSFEYGLNASAKSFDGTHKYIRITDIDDSSRKFNSQSLTSPDIDLSSADNHKLKNGDILFARTGASVGKSYIYADSDGLVYYAGFLIRARIKSGVDSNFVFQHTLTSSYENFIRVTSQRSGQPGVNAKEYSTFEISVPSYEEQRKIGSFFKQLDDTITLHQRKLDKLKLLKQGYLQQLFPQNDEKVPRFRFANFDENWEQRKLGSLSENTFGGGTPKTKVLEYWSGTIPWIQSSDLENNKLFNVLPKKYITENAVKNSATKIVPSSSIVIVTRVGVGKLAFMTYEYTTSQDFLSLSNLNTDGIFSTYAIYKLLQKELNNIQGTSIKGITKTDLLEKNIVIPSALKEQEKIGSLFKQLDETITLHQSKLDKLKSIKEAFLQKMFI